MADATTEQAANNGTISIWLDDENISTATVDEAITGGEAIIKGNFDQDSASALANQINSGALPFALSAESYSTISPSLGAKSLEVMVLAGIIAFALVCCDDDCALPSARYHRYHLFCSARWSLPWLSFPATLLCSRVLP